LTPTELVKAQKFFEANKDLLSKVDPQSTSDVYNLLTENISIIDKAHTEIRELTEYNSLNIAKSKLGFSQPAVDPMDKTVKDFTEWFQLSLDKTKQCQATIESSGDNLVKLDTAFRNISGKIDNIKTPKSNFIDTLARAGLDAGKMCLVECTLGIFVPVGCAACMTIAFGTAYKNAVDAINAKLDEYSRIAGSLKTDLKARRDGTDRVRNSANMTENTFIKYVQFMKDTQIEVVNSAELVDIFERTREELFNALVKLDTANKLLGGAL
jgi:hypothetical protein